MNILLTSVGRRAYMVKYFKEALAGAGEVHVCNSDDRTVAFQYADHGFLSPLIYDSSYIPTLLSYCRENRISLLLSLFDIDLLILAQHRREFSQIGTEVLVSSPELIRMCNDKWETFRFLAAHSIPTPRTYLRPEDVQAALASGEIRYPVIVKPRFGCGSIALSVAEDSEALSFLGRKVEREIEKTYLKFESAAASQKVLFQEMLCGQEYGADIINDLQGRFQNVIVKKKLAMRAGETDIAETVCEPAISDMLSRLGRLTGHTGNLDCDVILADGVPFVLELNARFGGGYPFSHAAGADLPRAILLWARGEKVPETLLRARTGVRAYKELVLTPDRFSGPAPVPDTEKQPTVKS